MKTKYFKTAFLSLSICFIFNVVSATPDTLIMGVNVYYVWSSGNGGDFGGNWGGYYNLSFDQSRNMPAGDQMYVEIETYSICCGHAPWHKLDGAYPLNWYNDNINHAFTGQTNGTIHTSIDIYPSQGSVATIYIRFVYISANGGGIHASVFNARYNLAPTHLENVTATINGSSCDNPLNVIFHLPVECSQCQNGGSADDIYVNADFGDGSDTLFLQCCPGQHHTYNLSHSYNSIGTFNPTFHVFNGYGGGYDTLPVTVNPKPPAAVTASSLTFCEGDSIILNAIVQPNNSYQWKKGGIDIPGATSSTHTALVGGNYKVTVTNTLTGCSRTTAPATSLIRNPRPVATVSPQGPTTFCAGDNVVLKANSGSGLTYHWKKDNTFISGANGINYTAFVPGVYKVQVTNSFGCKKSSYGIPVFVPCKEDGTDQQMSDEINNPDLHIFPNPSSGKFTIQSSKKISQITITNLSGQTILKKDIKNNFNSPIEIDLTKQSKGIYCIQVITGKEVYNQKIILN